MVGNGPLIALKHGNGPDLKEVALVDKLALALLQLGPQPPELALILAQQGTLIHILIHPGCIADVLGPVGKLQGAQRLCNAHQDSLWNAIQQDRLCNRASCTVDDRSYCMDNYVQLET